MASNIFSMIRIRSLFIWLIVGIFTLSSLHGFISNTFGIYYNNPLFGVLGQFFTYFIVILWMKKKFSDFDTNFNEMIFKNTIILKLYYKEIAFVVPVLIMFSTGAFTILYVYLSYIFPTYITGILQDRMISTPQETIFSSVTNIVNIISIALLAPFTEEIFFRGILYNKVLKRWGKISAFILPSLFFCSLHANFVGMFIFGIVMTILYTKTKSLILPMVCHALNNTISLFFTYIPFLINGQEEIATLEQFRDGLWFGTIIFVIALSFVIYYLHKNRISFKSSKNFEKTII